VSFEADLNAHLAGDAGVAQVVGERIWPQIRPETDTALPAITTLIVDTVPSNDLDNGDGSLLNKRVQIDVWAEDYDSARNLAELVRTRMKTSATNFSSLMNSDQDLYEQETKLFRVLMDFSCWYTVPD